MDALALLCNLHADGPESLQRLKGAGCDRIELLVALEVGELSALLRTPDASSRRFLEEARGLAQRLTGRALEHASPCEPAPSERAPGESAGAAGRPPSRPGAAARRAEGPVVFREPPSPTPMVSRDAARDLEEAFDEVASDVDLDYPARAARPGSDPLAEVVLQAWRELDSEAPSEPGGPAVPSTASTVKATPLATACVEGLTEDVRAALADSGLTTLEELLAAEPLDLAKRSGIAYTRARRLCFLARRAVADAPAEVGPPAPAAELALARA